MTNGTRKTSTVRKRKTDERMPETPRKRRKIDKGGHRSGVKDAMVQHRVPQPSRRCQLPRPKRPSTFTLPTHLFPDGLLHQESSNIQNSARGTRSGSSTPSTNQPESPLLRLSRIDVLLTATHRRNKNQHRNQCFYRHLLTLRRSIKKLLALHKQSAALVTSNNVSANLPLVKQPVTSAAEVRQRFEKESVLRSQREVIEEHIRETVVPMAYVAFSGVVADQQFANLGVVLIGLLTDVVGVVGTMRTIEVQTPKRVAVNKIVTESVSGGRLIGLSTLITGPDQGTVIERIYDSDSGVAVESDTKNTGMDQEMYNNEVDLGEVVCREDLNEHNTRRKKDDLPAEPMLPPMNGKREEREQSTISLASTSAPLNPMSNPTSQTLPNKPQAQIFNTTNATSTFTSKPQPKDINQTEKPTNSNLNLILPPPSTKTTSKRLPNPLPPKPAAVSNQPPQPASSSSSSSIPTILNLALPPKPSFQTTSVHERKVERSEEKDGSRDVNNKEEEKEKRKRKRKKTQKNAIDDLFSAFS